MFLASSSALFLHTLEYLTMKAIIYFAFEFHGKKWRIGENLKKVIEHQNYSLQNCNSAFFVVSIV